MSFRYFQFTVYVLEQYLKQYSKLNKLLNDVHIDCIPKIIFNHRFLFVNSEVSLYEYSTCIFENNLFLKNTSQSPPFWQGEFSQSV